MFVMVCLNNKLSSERRFGGVNEQIVKYKNELNSIALRKFKSKEMDLFFSICSKMKNKGLNKVQFTFEELKNLSDYKLTATKYFVSDLESVYDKMLSLTYRKEDKDGVIFKFVLFNGFTINPLKQYVEISVNPELEYILNELSNEFTQFELKEFTELSSSYSKTMYRLLKQFKSTGFYTVKIEDFKELLDIPKSYRMGNIDQQILNPIKKELSQYFEPFEIKKIKAKKGNRIERLEFIFIEKSHEVDSKIPKVTLHNWVTQ